MMLLSLLFFGLLFLVIGQITLIWPPKKVNPLYGYRSSRAMQTLATYRAAQLYSSRIERNFGVALLIACLFSRWATHADLIRISGGWIAALLTFAIISLMIITRLLTEKHLKTHFDASGNPKQIN